MNYSNSSKANRSLVNQMNSSSPSPTRRRANDGNGGGKRTRNRERQRRHRASSPSGSTRPAHRTTSRRRRKDRISQPTNPTTKQQGLDESSGMDSNRHNVRNDNRLGQSNRSGMTQPGNGDNTTAAISRSHTRIISPTKPKRSLRRSLSDPETLLVHRNGKDDSSISLDRFEPFGKWKPRTNKKVQQEGGTTVGTTTNPCDDFTERALEERYRTKYDIDPGIADLWQQMGNNERKAFDDIDQTTIGLGKKEVEEHLCHPHGVDPTTMDHSGTHSTNSATCVEGTCTTSTMQERGRRAGSRRRGRDTRSVSPTSAVITNDPKLMVRSCSKQRLAGHRCRRIQKQESRTISALDNDCDENDNHDDDGSIKLMYIKSEVAVEPDEHQQLNDIDGSNSTLGSLYSTASNVGNKMMESMSSLFAKPGMSTNLSSSAATSTTTSILDLAMPTTTTRTMKAFDLGTSTNLSLNKGPCSQNKMMMFGLSNYGMSSWSVGSRRNIMMLDEASDDEEMEDEIDRAIQRHLETSRIGRRKKNSNDHLERTRAGEMEEPLELTTEQGVDSVIQKQLEEARQEKMEKKKKKKKKLSASTGGLRKSHSSSSLLNKSFSSTSKEEREAKRARVRAKRREQRKGQFHSSLGTSPAMSDKERRGRRKQKIATNRGRSLSAGPRRTSTGNSQGRQEDPENKSSKKKRKPPPRRTKSVQPMPLVSPLNKTKCEISNDTCQSGDKGKAEQLAKLQVLWAASIGQNPHVDEFGLPGKESACFSSPKRRNIAPPMQNNTCFPKAG